MKQRREHRRRRRFGPGGSGVMGGAIVARVRRVPRGVGLFLDDLEVFDDVVAEGGEDVGGAHERGSGDARAEVVGESPEPREEVAELRRERVGVVRGEAPGDEEAAARHHPAVGVELRGEGGEFHRGVRARRERGRGDVKLAHVHRVGLGAGREDRRGLSGRRHRGASAGRGQRAVRRGARDERAPRRLRGRRARRRRARDGLERFARSGARDGAETRNLARRSRDALPPPGRKRRGARARARGASAEEPGRGEARRERGGAGRRERRARDRESDGDGALWVR